MTRKDEGPSAGRLPDPLPRADRRLAVGAVLFRVKRSQSQPVIDAMEAEARDCYRRYSNVASDVVAFVQERWAALMGQEDAGEGPASPSCSTAGTRRTGSSFHGVEAAAPLSYPCASLPEVNIPARERHADKYVEIAVTCPVSWTPGIALAFAGARSSRGGRGRGGAFRRAGAGAGARRAGAAFAGDFRRAGAGSGAGSGSAPSARAASPLLNHAAASSSPASAGAPPQNRCNSPSRRFSASTSVASSSSWAIASSLVGTFRRPSWIDVIAEAAQVHLGTALPAPSLLVERHRQVAGGPARRAPRSERGRGEARDGRGELVLVQPGVRVLGHIVLGVS